MSHENIDEAFDSILDYQAHDVPRITERVFKATILPMIANEDDESADYTGWLTIAGSWRRPIDVVDDLDGTVLFRVPALVGDNDLPIAQTGSNSAFEIIQNARRKMLTVPKAGDEHLVRGLSSRVKVKGDLTENQKRWNYIYERYGLAFRAGDGVDGATENVSTTDTPDVVGYDEI